MNTASLSIILLAVIFGVQPAGALTAWFTSPSESEVFTEPDITVYGGAGGDTWAWELGANQDFQGGTFERSRYLEGTGIAIDPGFSDDFSGSAIDSAAWTVDTGGGIGASVSGGELVLAGTENAEVWGGTELGSRERFNGSFALYAKVGAGGGGSGYGVGFGLKVSDNVFFRCGPLKDAGRNRNTLLYVNYKTGQTGDGIDSDNDPRGLDGVVREYGLVYNSTSGAVKVYLDGELKATKTWITGASGYSVFIAGWARLNGDRLDGRVDSIRLGYTDGNYLSPARALESDGLSLKSVTWNVSTPPATQAALQIRHRSTNGQWDPWEPVVPGQEISAGLHGAIQFRLGLSTDDPAVSPSVSRLKLEWASDILGVSASLDGAAWTPLIGTTDWSGKLALSAGFNNIRVLVRDSSGMNITVNRSAWFHPPKDVPSGRLAINDNDTYTISRAVTISFSLAPGPNAAFLKVSNSADLSAAPWMPYTERMPWNLSDGDGDKRVHAVFLSDAGILSRTLVDSIILDTTAPNIRILYPADGSESIRKRTAVGGTAFDRNGLRSVELRVDAGNWTLCVGLENWSAAAELAAMKGYRLEARVTDMVGHISQTAVSVRRVPAPSRSLLTLESLLAVLILLVVAGVLSSLWLSRKQGRAETGNEPGDGRGSGTLRRSERQQPLN